VPDTAPGPPINSESVLVRGCRDGQAACKVFQDAEAALKAYTPLKQGSQV